MTSISRSLVSTRPPTLAPRPRAASLRPRVVRPRAGAPEPPPGRGKPKVDLEATLARVQRLSRAVAELLPVLGSMASEWRKLGLPEFNIQEQPGALGAWLCKQVAQHRGQGCLPWLTRLDDFRHGQQTFHIKGDVRDAVTGAPIVGACVTLKTEPNICNRCGADGAFGELRLDPAVGRVWLEVTSEHYVPYVTYVTVGDAGEATVLKLRLQRRD